MASIVRWRAAWRAKWPINRANYTGWRDHPLKRGRGGLVDAGRHGSMASDGVGGVGRVRRLATPRRTPEDMDEFVR
jgi:hypothetical protein